MRRTWQAARASAHCALTAADLVASGERAAYALCRPPGHHAGHAVFGGYCFLNNAALAAQRLRDAGMRRVAVLTGIGLQLPTLWPVQAFVLHVEAV